MSEDINKNIIVSVIEVPSPLNKLESHTIKNSNSKEEINKSTAVCDTDVLKSTDKKEDCLNSHIEHCKYL